MQDESHGMLHGLSVGRSVLVRGLPAEGHPAGGARVAPGGAKKFTIRYDPKSDRWWSLTNWAQTKDRPEARDANYHRNTLALTSAKELRQWKVESVVLYHPDVRHTGFQYADWHFDGDDLIAVARTAYGQAPNCHDANYLTFHRIPDFRRRTMDDRPLNDSSERDVDGGDDDEPRQGQR
jgi:hypothetical protein